MVFVKRDKNNEICALMAKKDGKDCEELDMNHPEVLLFLANSSSDAKNYKLLRSDLAFIRVLEDLIQVLIEKNFISITDFPAPVIEKLVERNKIRNLFRNVGGLIDKD